jgi:hypothetical protein
MRPHVGAKTLARYRQGDLSPRRNSRIGAHLAGCDRCRALNEDLAGVTTLLASVHPPPIPEHLEARIQAALATEAARATRPGEQAVSSGEKAAAAPASAGTGPTGTGPAGNGRRPRPEVPGHRRRARPARPAIALRALAAAAVVVLLGGGIYGLTRLGASSTSSSAGPAAAPEVPASGGTASGPAHEPAATGPALPYRHAGGTDIIIPVSTGTDYTPGNLSGQVTARLDRQGRSPELAGPDVTSPGLTHSPAAAGRPSTFQRIPVATLAGCVNRIAAGERVLLVDVARYQDAPATVIVTQPAAGGPEQVWVVGTGCSASRSDLLHHATLNTAG